MMRVGSLERVGASGVGHARGHSLSAWIQNMVMRVGSLERVGASGVGIRVGASLSAWDPEHGDARCGQSRARGRLSVGMRVGVV